MALVKYEVGGNAREVEDHLERLCLHGDILARLVSLDKYECHILTGIQVETGHRGIIHLSVIVHQGFYREAVLHG